VPVVVRAVLDGIEADDTAGPVVIYALEEEQFNPCGIF
jgi:hypothetical protein